MVLTQLSRTFQYSSLAVIKGGIVGRYLCANLKPRCAVASPFLNSFTMHFVYVCVVFCNYENRQDADLGLLLPKVDLHDHRLRCFLILRRQWCAGSPPTDQAIMLGMTLMLSVHALIHRNHTYHDRAWLSYHVLCLGSTATKKELSWLVAAVGHRSFALSSINNDLIMLHFSLLGRCCWFRSS